MKMQPPQSPTPLPSSSSRLPLIHQSSSVSSSTSSVLISHYTPDEKLNLLNGADLWKLHPIDRSGEDIDVGVGVGVGVEQQDSNQTSGPPAAAGTTMATTTTTTTGLSDNGGLVLQQNLQSIRMSDGPHGVRKPIGDFGLNDAHPSTCFPSACATACSWNSETLYKLGLALKEECHAHDVQVLLGPGINIKRYPAGGRNHEYFSEDPYHTGILARSYIQGVQSESSSSPSVAACLKHYAVNNQESHMMVVDAVVDDRTLREIYLRAFEICIRDVGKEQQQQHQQLQQPPRTVMAAYNQVNGNFCSEHGYLLDTILRKEWNYEGVVVSDWGAVNDRAKGIQAGMDLEMPGNQGACHEEFIIVPSASAEEEQQTTTTTTTENNWNTNTDTTTPATTLSGRNQQQYLNEMYIDTSASRIARLVHDYQPKSYHDSVTNTISYNVNNSNNNSDVDIEQPFETGDSSVTGRRRRSHNRLSLTEEDFDSMFDRHHQLAREMATECIVMLQNRDQLLPLALSFSDETDSTNTPAGPGPQRRSYRNVAVIGDFGKDNPRIQGMGSAKVTAARMTNVYDCLKDEIQKSSSSCSSVLTFSSGYDVDGESDDVDTALIEHAVATARDADVALVFVGLPEIMESEGFDRPHCRLPQQHISLVEAVCNVNTNVVIVLSNGGIVSVPESFVAGAKAILEGFLLGQAGGRAIVDVLLGKVSPSGKMPETVVMDTSHIPAHPHFPGTRHTVEYREGLDVGYRYFNKKSGSGIDDPDLVQFPFGHGLQYTAFEYRNLRVSIQNDSPVKKHVVVSVDVQNKGVTHTAKEVLQLYVRTIGSAVYRPAHELKGFEKVEFSPGETKTVTFSLNERAFAFYDIGLKEWIVEPGPECSFEIQVGASSRDIRLCDTISFTAGKEASFLAQESYPPVHNAACREVGGEYYVDDTTFAKRFGTSELSVLDIISRKNEENVHETFVHRNTLLKEAAKMSLLGWFLFQFTYNMAISEVKRGPRRKREVRMIRANVENLPLRVLVLFAKGTLSFRLLDFLILLMNGCYLAAFRSVFRRRRRQQPPQ
mmetsp:Transcript_34965/g.84615  ORF Transcript_34965/g.84615 Transcript_34965/m.84615 type:complete len:1056 (-) Transcript_34965:187-3354(-)